ncbi:MAG: hypothetical protein ETSY1_06855 [Candidatus Entotheonella factor]|uniref:Lipocalin-like domain-containing protein n=1 Tax=Entotheonella factor TaxID=1429438 RepID=W4LV18_ENTF1|nr:MAG: hypothetical protein ETSY1_06855 [Candidatus Entotheonella factor]
MSNKFLGTWNMAWTGGYRAAELVHITENSGNLTLTYPGYENGYGSNLTLGNGNRSLTGTWHQDNAGPGPFTFVLQGDDIIAGVWSGGVWNGTRKDS